MFQYDCRERRTFPKSLKTKKLKIQRLPCCSCQRTYCQQTCFHMCSHIQMDMSILVMVWSLLHLWILFQNSSTIFTFRALHCRFSLSPHFAGLRPYYSPLLCLLLLSQLSNILQWLYIIYAEAHFCILKIDQLNRHVVTFKGRSWDGWMKK